MKKVYLAIGNNNFWYAQGTKKECVQQAKLALAGKGGFEDQDLPQVEEVNIFEAKEVDTIYPEDKNEE